MNLAERKYQESIIRRLRRTFPGCVILKNDANYLQGVPDLLLLWRERWATFEIKTSERAPNQPNQEYYVLLMDAMSFSSFIYPENEDEVFHALQFAFQTYRSARVSKRQQVSLDQLRRRQADRGMDELPGSQARNRTSRSGSSTNSSRR